MLKTFLQPQIEGTCGQCQMGRLHLQSMTITHWLGDNLVLVPGVEVAICDICGAVVYLRDLNEFFDNLFDDFEKKTKHSSTKGEGLLILPVVKGHQQ